MRALVGDTKVEANCMAHIIDVLLPDGLIQTVLLEDVGLCGRREAALSFIEWTAWNGVHQRKDDYGYSKENHHQRKNSPTDVT
tara:strand:- start:1382 stop:1630 length:249 start_codon:yes stop_codon:yes gene_type:complete